MGDGGEATGGSGSIEIPSARAVPFPAASETEDSDYMLEIERELFVPSSIDSDAEIEEELFISLPISPATEIPSVPLVAESSPAILQTKAVKSPRAEPMALAEAPGTASLATTQPVGKPPSAMALRPAARPNPRPLPADPLASLKALTDEERIALFT
jgi:hypothetical protein